MLTGKLGAFGAGVEGVASCENGCRALGKTHSNSGTCTGGQKLPGTDTYTPTGCCCK